ncbi:MAG: hypothetical protein WCO30_02235 [bacterium]
MDIETLISGALNQAIVSVRTIWPLMSIVLPIVLIWALWKMRVYYVRRKFDKGQQYVLLEIKLPKEIHKSPAAMELFLTVLHQTSQEASPYHTHWLGKSRAISSLEIVSLGGVVHFYVRVRSGIKNHVEAALYAQYPGVEVFPAEDYTKNVFYVNSDIELFGSEFVLKKNNAYPIKTYVDYGLDRDPKEEFKIDPITHMIEFLSIFTRDEQFWLQLVIRSYKGAMANPVDKWETDAKKEVDKILSRDPKTRSIIKEVSEKDKFPMIQISKGEQEQVDSIQRAQNKLAFEVGIRAMYLAKKDKFIGVNISGLMSIVKQFSANNFNFFGPKNFTSNDDYPWQDWAFLTRKKKRRMLAAYKTRQFFFAPYERPTNIMNTEALATIFHLPGQVMAAPSVARVESTKSEPPVNLPI